ncbi:aspartate carbamoyltransferase [Plasmodium brasilianum]|uniref:aspartate carbamoyltransferase n=2 Tax=Plasmodium (Plasmodium) TaxID=418103 RepID=A0A1D3SNY4_PLAMA|nr:aspartate carbamoyltransferase, putative [Plasmodium malariae]KAI4836346.1 aspartate carbamoyltransferase [Plasmodium brasilianum]SCO93613.1 aspartate carbamoyltransferase, putative [Plasmodium malariae]
MIEILSSIFVVFTFLMAAILAHVISGKRKAKLIIGEKNYLNNKYKINLDMIIEKMKNKNVINIDDINDEELLAILFTAKKFESILKNNENSRYLDNKVFCSIFLEPSTRTRCSFDSAILRLGSKVINITDMNSTSFYKGETVQDAFTILSKYVDGIIYRDPSNNNVDLAVASSKKPIINAGNGTGEHPTQSLLDFYTIYNFFPFILERDKNQKINIAFVGDLKNGRTVHSLSKLLSRYNVNFNFVSCKSLDIPEYITHIIINNLKRNNFYNENSIKKYDNLENGLKDAHVIYMTRIQKERFSDLQEYNNYKDAFILDNNVLKNIREDAKILHPLPRVNEIKVEVDENPKSVYFLQAENGLYVRMALLYLIFS